MSDLSPRGGSGGMIDEVEDNFDAPPDDAMSIASSDTDLADQSSTRSVTGSIFEQQQLIENGRRYANDTYYMPNDEVEQTRLSLTHRGFLRLLDGNLTLSHIGIDVKRILDVGTGTGEWAIAMGDRYPHAQIVATDLSPIQPAYVPPNVEFEVDNVQNEPWTYGEPFDFIHMRNLKGSFADWGSIYREAYRNLQPGGILEVSEIGPFRVTGSPPPDQSQHNSERTATPSTTHHDSPDTSACAIYNAVRKDAASKAGITIGLEHLDPILLREADFSIQRELTVNLPVGPWDTSDAKQQILGKIALVAILEMLEGTSIRMLTRELGWQVKEVRELCMKVQDELTSPWARAVVPIGFIIGRKMTGAEAGQNEV
ncbi:hypothetical protein MMC25_000538 [Agyrium rufum]|nr:hypothetical protein [Agyrium rufum]